MKYTILSLYLLSNTILLIAQESNQIPLGKVSYSYTTDFFLTSSGKAGEATLYFNNTLSYYKHNTIPKGDTVEEEGMNINYIRGDKYGFPIIIDQTNKKIVSRIPIGDDKALMEEPLEKVSWKINADTSKIIGGYTCNLAFGISFGRTYLVWFTKEIPISAGPYKLNGLPGLILAGRSLDKKVNFMFNSLEISKNIPFKMIVPETKLTLIGYCGFRNKLNEIREKLNLEYIAKGKETIDWAALDISIGDDAQIARYKPCK